ncbi:unnamed protein product [Rhizoctonia solani]|uniref:Uncharacterized protein n=1 Tax=Rhizoctonia solani TaxID=456999 RepID=A0A8H3CYM8_9AGAM|nr:unnamed protein product [Rhizoctonia solani]
MTSSACLPLPNSASLGKFSTVAPAHNDGSLNQSATAPGLQQDTSLLSGRLLVPHGEYPAGPTECTSATPNAGYVAALSTIQIATVADQLSPPTDGVHDNSAGRPRISRSMVVPSQASVPDSTFRLTQLESIATPTSKSPESRSIMAPTTGGSCLVISSQSQADPILKWPASLDNEPQDEDSESIEAALLNGLVLDRQVESNAIPYIVHCFAASLIRFTFEPTRLLSVLRDYISYDYSSGHETRQILILMSNISLTTAQSTDYDLTDFITLRKQLVGRVVDARAQAELTRDSALMVMNHSHQLIATLWKVGSLANVLNIMDLYAPVFRRACPEPPDGLVNFPRRLAAMEMDLKYYAALDILQSFITHRPMFFQYDLDYPSSQEEALVKLDCEPGLRWLYGVPDRLMITLARMNTLFEVHGSSVDPAMVQGLEEEIEDCALVLNMSPGVDPTLNIGRATALCGANSTDARVVKVLKKAMRLLRGVKPLRNTDSFLVLPMIVLGVAATSSKDRSTLFSRLRGVSECTRPGTVGNDLVRILDDIWARTTGRPAEWMDLRTACSRVTGK